MTDVDLSRYAGVRGKQTPRVGVYPAATHHGFAEEVIDLMDGLRVPLDPYQQYVLRGGLGQNEAPDLSGYEWAAEQCGCWVPRQNGKGNIIMALHLGWMYILKEPLIVHSAHEYKTAQEAFLRIRDLAQGNRDLDRLVNRYWQANGEQGIELTKRAGGSRLRFMARTNKAGRGFTTPKLTLDEAQFLEENQMRAIMPVVSSFPNWQIWYFGTPPDPISEGATVSDAWIYNIKEAGEKGKPRRAWFDWGIPTLDLEDPEQLAILYDPETWLNTNPAVNRPSRTNSMRLTTIAGELDTFGAGQAFAMERCGMWLPRAGDGKGNVIDPDRWRDSVAEKTMPDSIAIAFHVNPKRTHATIAFAGMIDGRWRVGIIAHKRGTDWLMPKLRECKTKFNPLAWTVDAKSETTVDDLASELGVKLPEVAEEPKWGELWLPTAADVATSFGLFVDSANNDQLRHHDEQPLTKGINAGTRPLSGGATWDEKGPIEIGPPKAVGLAMLAYRERVEKVKDNYDPLANIW